MLKPEIECNGQNKRKNVSPLRSPRINRILSSDESDGNESRNPKMQLESSGQKTCKRLCFELSEEVTNNVSTESENIKSNGDALSNLDVTDNMKKDENFHKKSSGEKIVENDIIHEISSSDDSSESNTSDSDEYYPIRGNN